MAHSSTMTDSDFIISY